MPATVVIPGLGEVVFPDHMDDGAIARAVEMEVMPQMREFAGGAETPAAEPQAQPRARDVVWAEKVAHNKAVATALPAHIASNPAVTNFLFSVLGKVFEQKPFMQGLTNIPNTLVVAGHSEQNTIGGGGGFGRSGLMPDESMSDPLSQAVRERDKHIHANVDPLVLMNDYARFGGVTLKEIATAMGSATNDVKRVILMSCYAAGYSPEEVRTIFPNADDIISPPANEDVVLFNRGFDLFREPDRAGESERLIGTSPLFRYTREGTSNEIKQGLDWTTGTPDWWLKQARAIRGSIPLPFSQRPLPPLPDEPPPVVPLIPEVDPKDWNIL